MVQSICLLSASPVPKVICGIREAHLKAKQGKIAYQVHNLCDYLTLGLHGSYSIWNFLPLQWTHILETGGSSQQYGQALRCHDQYQYYHMKNRWKSSNTNVDLLQAKRSRTIQMGTWGLITSQGKVQPLLFSQLSSASGMPWVFQDQWAPIPWHCAKLKTTLRHRWQCEQSAIEITMINDTVLKEINWLIILRPSSEVQCWAVLAKCCRTAHRRPDNLCKWGGPLLFH